MPGPAAPGRGHRGIQITLNCGSPGANYEQLLPRDISENKYSVGWGGPRSQPVAFSFLIRFVPLAETRKGQVSHLQEGCAVVKPVFSPEQFDPSWIVNLLLQGFRVPRGGACRCSLCVPGGGEATWDKVCAWLARPSCFCLCCHRLGQATPFRVCR